MIFLNLTGGLGNQLFQLNAAIALSNPGEEIRVEWKLGSPRLADNGLPEIFSFILPPRVKLITRSSKWLPFLSKVLGFTLRSQHNPIGIAKVKVVNRLIVFSASLIMSVFFHKRFQFVCPKDLGFENLIRNSKHGFLNGYFQSYFWPDIARIEIGKLVSLNSDLSYYKELAKTEEPIIIHVRRGDYKTESTFGLLGSRYYKKSLEVLANKQVNCDNIWLFSDEPDLALVLMKKVTDNNIRLIPTSGLNSAETLEIMALGKAYVIANSTFSWWAAYSSSVPTVIAPRQWFKDVADPNMLLPKHWHLVDPSYE